MVTHFGKSLLNACSGITSPPVQVSTLHFSVACQLGPISAGIWTVANTSVIASVCISDIYIHSGSPLCLASHSDWWYCKHLQYRLHQGGSHLCQCYLSFVLYLSLSLVASLVNLHGISASNVQTLPHLLLVTSLAR